MGIHLINHMVLDWAASVLEVDVDPLGRQLGKFCSNIICLVVDRAIKTQFGNDPVALFIVACDTNDIQTFGLGQLAHNGAH